MLGIDSSGKTVIVELKRGRTPRETIAQLLEYASFVESLDYEQLNMIFREYSDEDTELDDYCKEYFSDSEEDNVSWNKASVLIVVGQLISREVKQVAFFLRRKGLDVRCAEFKYFQSDTSRIITCDYVVGSEDMAKNRVRTSASPKVDKRLFLDAIDEYGKPIFETVFSYVDRMNLFIRWGSRGFSVNYKDDSGYVALFFCYPPQSVFKQSIYTGYDEIDKKIEQPENVNTYYRAEVKKLSVFVKSQKSEKWIIDREFPNDLVERFLAIVEQVVARLKESTWRTKGSPLSE